MKKLLLLVLLPLVCFAKVTIITELPTALVNGDPFTAVSGDTVNVSRNGGAYTSYAITSAQALAGSFTVSDNSASNCKKDTWLFSYTIKSNGLTSDPSSTYTTTVDGVNCVVKFVPNAVIK